MLEKQKGKRLSNERRDYPKKNIMETGTDVQYIRTLRQGVQRIITREMPVWVVQGESTGGTTPKGKWRAERNARIDDNHGQLYAFNRAGARGLS
jgi:hypothetical protein